MSPRGLTLTEIRHTDAARRFEPTEHYNALREQCPLHHVAEHDPPFYAVSRFEDVVEVLRRNDLWSNRHGPGVFHQESGVLGSADDPDHARQRRVLRAALVPPVVARMEPFLRDATDALLDAVDPVGGHAVTCEFVSAIAEPLPALAIADLLGVDPGLHDNFRRWSNESVAALTGGDVAGYQAAKAAVEDCVADGVATRRAMIGDHTADDDLLGNQRPDDVMSRLAVAQHKPNVYIDLSGWSPKYFPEILVRYCNSILKKKVLFGSAWPMITTERWLNDFENIAIKDESRPDIIKNNAARLLGLGG